MTGFALAWRGRSDVTVAALAVLLRASAGLVVHGLRHPFRPGRICRISGRVRVR